MIVSYAFEVLGSGAVILCMCGGVTGIGGAGAVVCIEGMYWVKSREGRVC